MPPAEGSHRNRTGKDKVAKCAQLALQDEEFEDMIPINAGAVISDDHNDGINDPKFHKGATESPLTK